MSSSELGNLIRASTQDVFKTMLQTELLTGDSYENRAPVLRSEVTALIGLAGEFQGSLFVHCTFEQARAFTACMMGCEPAEIQDQDEILDALGEVANMIAGNLKRLLPGPKRFEISVPSTVMNAQSGIHVKARDSVVAPFDGALGGFLVEVVLEER